MRISFAMNKCKADRPSKRYVEGICPRIPPVLFSLARVEATRLAMELLKC